MPLLAALATLVFYWHTTAFGFVLDDELLYQKSASLTDLGSIARGFVTDVGALRTGSSAALGSFYRPLFLALSTLYYQLVGGQPFAWHLAAVALAAAIAGLAALFFMRLGFPPLGSLLGALVFSLHPTHVGSVAWAAGLQDLLAAVFVLAALLALLSPVGEDHPKRALAVSATAYALALLCKEVSIALLPVVAVWAYARRDEPGQSRRFGRAAVLLAVVTAAYLAARVAALSGLANPWPRAPGLALSLPAMPLAFVTYLRMLLWPTSFSFFRPERPIWGPFDLPVVVSAAVVALLAVISLVAIRRRRELLLPLAWFVLWLLPVMNFWALPAEWMVTDRYLFMPALALPWTLLVLLPRRAATPSLSVLALAFAILTLRYTAIFADQKTFVEAMAKAEPTSSFIVAKRGRILLDEGKPGAAEAAFRRAAELEPRDPDILRDLGDRERERGDLVAAETHYRRAVAEEPYASKPFKLLALALAAAGQPDKAAALLEESTRRWPQDFEVQLMRAVSLGVAGRRSEAEAAFEAARRLRPGDPAVEGGLDATLSRLGAKLSPAGPES